METTKERSEPVPTWIAFMYKRMIVEVLKRAKDKGCKTFIFCCIVSNVELNIFYLNLSFVFFVFY